MSPRKEEPLPLHENHVRRETKGLYVAVVVLPILTYFGTVFTMAENVATKPWVNGQIVDVKNVFDSKISEVLKEAINHSDMNKQLMAIEIERYASIVKSLEVKIDAMGTSIDRMYRETFEDRPRKGK